MSDESLAPLHGRCMCETVRFELSEQPPGYGICHCKRCQRRTGAGFSSSAPMVPGSLSFLAGEESIRWYDPGDGGWSKAFCGECGSSLFTRPPDTEEPFAVRMGAIDEDFGAEAFFHQYTDYAPDWAPVPDDGLPQFAERRPS